jgi:hypothetical protein
MEACSSVVSAINPEHYICVVRKGLSKSWPTSYFAWVCLIHHSMLRLQCREVSGMGPLRNM